MQIRAFAISMCAGIVFMPAAFAQPNPAERVREICLPIVNASVTSSSTVSQASAYAQQFETFICSQNYSSEEEATNAGINVSAMYKGVPIGFLWSNDQQKRSQARSAICSQTSGGFEAAYNYVVTQIQRDPHANREYMRCVEKVLASTADLVCSIYSDVADPAKLTLQIVYRPSSTRVGRLGNVSLSGARVPRGQPTIRELILQGRSSSARLEPFSLPIELERLGVGSGSFQMTLTDGQSCQARFENLPAILNVKTTVNGQGIAPGEHNQSFSFGRDRNCGDDAQVVAEEKKLEPNTVMVSAQDFVSQSHVGSSNCPADASKLRSIQPLNDGSGVRIEYSLVGCGYSGFWKTCNGRGWLDGSVRVRTRTLDPNLPTLHTRVEKEQRFDDGRVGLTQVQFRDAVPHDFRISGYSFVAEAALPEGGSNGQPQYRRLVISGSTLSAPSTPDPGCKQFVDAGGRLQSVAGVFTGNGVVTIVQRDEGCEGFRQRIADIASLVSGVTPATRCANRLDGPPRLREGSDPNTADGRTIFEQGLRCTR